MLSQVKRRTFSEPIPESGLETKEVVGFDHKKDKNGLILRYKARLMARGFTQKRGINYKETFALTIRLDTLRIILATAVRHNWKVYQMDVVAAFLATTLQEEIFMKVLDELQQHFSKYVKILKSSYGLKQAARMWYLLMLNFLKKFPANGRRSNNIPASRIESHYRSP